MNKIKKYYRITFQLASPLAVSSGEDFTTDRDIVKDSRGIPYIPGSALAGMYRKLFSGKTAEKYFGPELTKERMISSSEKGKNELSESLVVVYDACIQAQQPDSIVTKRDMVALDEYKTAIEGAKFDFEVLEPSVTFVTYIEQNMENADQQYVINEIADAWMKGRITLGAKTMRGYGHTKGIKAEAIMYDLADSVQLNAWLKFDMYQEDWNLGDTYNLCDSSCLSSLSGLPEKQADGVREKYKMQEIALAQNSQCLIQLTLEQRGGISIRQYTTAVNEEDYRQLTAKVFSEKEKKQIEEIPVIPGTSWAGAFRAQMGRLDPGFRKDMPCAVAFFGEKKGQDTKSKSSRSRIGFSESRITGGKWVTYTHNAIDRFTGGTVDGALYTEKMYYNGKTDLTITCDFSRKGSRVVSQEERKHFASVMAAAILDLDNGYMAVGGLTSIGRGLFHVGRICIDGKVIFDKAQKIDNKEKMEGIYKDLRMAIAGGGEIVNV